MLQEKNQKYELDSILNDYSSWHTIADNQITEFSKVLRSPAKNLWLEGCQKAVADRNYQWLINYAQHNDISNLPIPLRYLDDIDDRKRKYAALFISNCALAALFLRRLSSDEEKEEYNTEFINCFLRAIFAWQKTRDLSCFDDKTTFSECIKTPTLDDLPKSSIDTNKWLEGITEAFAGENPNCEISPVEDLIYFFKGEERGWKKDKVAIANFPAVDKKRDRTEICQIEIEQRENGKGDFYRDPTKMSFSIIDTDFQESIHSASEYVKNNSSEWTNYDYRWRVKKWSKNNSTLIFDSSLMKKSVGLAAAIALNDSVRSNNLGADYVFTGIVDKDNGNITKIGYPKDKVEASVEKGLTIFVPKSNDNEELKREINSFINEVKFVNTFTDVTETIRNEKQKKKDVKDKEVWRWRWIKLGITAFIIFALATAVFGIWGKYNADQRTEIAEEKGKVAKDETDRLKDLTAKLDEKNKELTETNGQLEDTKKNLEIANGKLDKKNKSLTTTNIELDISRNEEAKQRKIAEEKKQEADKQKDIANEQKELAVLSEKEAQKQRRIADAAKQKLYARGLATKGYNFINEGNSELAKFYFAEAIKYDDQPEYRSGLLKSLGESLNYKFLWEKAINEDETDEESSNMVALSPDGDLLAVSIDRDTKIKIIQTSTGNEIKTLNLNGEKVESITLSPKSQKTNRLFEKPGLRENRRNEEQLLAVGTSGGNLILWETKNFEKKVISLTEPQDREFNKSFAGLSFSPDGNYLAIATTLNQVFVMKDGVIIKRFPNREIEKLGYLEKSDSDKLKEIVFDEKNSIYALKFIPSKIYSDLSVYNSLLIAFASGDLVLIPNMWENEVEFAYLETPGIGLIFTNESDFLTYGVGIDSWKIDSSFRNPIKSKYLYRPLLIKSEIASPLESFILSMSVNENLDLFTSAGMDYNFTNLESTYLRTKIWSLNKKKPILQGNSELGFPTNIQIGQNGTFILTVTKEDITKLYCWKFDLPLIKNSKTETEYVIYNNGFVAFYDSEDKSVKVKNLESQKVVFNFKDEKNYSPVYLALDKTGTYLLLSNEKDKLQVFNIRTSESFNLFTSTDNLRLEFSSSITFFQENLNFPVTENLLDAKQKINSAAIDSPDDRRIINYDKGFNYFAISRNAEKIAIRRKDNSIEIFSKQQLKKPLSIIQPKLEGEKNIDFKYSFNSDGKYIFIIPYHSKKSSDSSKLDGDKSEVNFYDTNTGKIKFTVPSTGSATSSITDCVSSSDGEGFITTHLDGSVNIWSINSYRQVLEHIPSDGNKISFNPVFVPNSNLIAWSSIENGQISFYDLKKKEKIGQWQTELDIDQLEFSDNNLYIYVTKELGVKIVSIDIERLLKILDGSKSSIHDELKNAIVLDSYPNSISQSELDTLIDKSSGQAFDINLVAKSSYDFTPIEKKSVFSTARKSDSRNLVSEYTKNQKKVANCKPVFIKPIFNPYKLTFSSPAEFCSHYPLIDIRKVDGGQYSQSLEEWKSDKQIEPNEQYYGLLYLSNGAANNLESDIHNVRVRINLKSLQNGKYVLEATTLAENASSLSATLNLKTLVNKQITVGNTIEIFDYQAKRLLKTIKMSDVLQKEGDKTTFEIPIGDLPPGFETDLFIRFRFIAK